MSTVAAQLPELTYESLFEGRRFSDTTMVVTKDMIRDYGRAVHNDALVAQASAASGTPLCDPSLMILFGIARRALRNDARLPPGGILAAQDFEAERPLRAGETVRTRPSVAAKYEKRGRRYVQLRCDLEDETGAKIGRVDSYIIWAPGAR
jgi:acyl dehydratase